MGEKASTHIPSSDGQILFVHIYDELKETSPILMVEKRPIGGAGKSGNELLRFLIHGLHPLRGQIIDKVEGSLITSIYKFYGPSGDEAGRDWLVKGELPCSTHGREVAPVQACRCGLSSAGSLVLWSIRMLLPMEIIQCEELAVAVEFRTELLGSGFGEAAGLESWA